MKYVITKVLPHLRKRAICLLLRLRFCGNSLNSLGWNGFTHMDQFEGHSGVSEENIRKPKVIM
jgi:hypothetical protein